MKTILILHTKESQRISYYGGFVLLKPGRNAITEIVWRKIKKNVWLQKLIKDKLMSLSTEVIDFEIKKIAELSKINDLEKLQKIFDKEKNGKIREFLARKIQKIMDKEQDKEKDKNAGRSHKI